MNTQLSAMPMPWSAIAYSVLGIGWLAVLWFLIRYVSTAPWFASEVGRHLVAMSAAVGGFFTLYLVLALWPELPGRGAVRLGLLLALVAVCVWRAVMFERQRTEDRKRGREGPS